MKTETAGTEHRNTQEKELNEKGISSDDFKHGWIKTKQGSYFIKNRHQETLLSEFIENTIESIISNISDVNYNFKVNTYKTNKIANLSSRDDSYFVFVTYIEKLGAIYSSSASAWMV